jgi:hypothetical protein
MPRFGRYNRVDPLKSRNCLTRFFDYEYTNNPLVYKDPEGLFTIDPNCGAQTGRISGAVYEVFDKIGETCNNCLDDYTTKSGRRLLQRKLMQSKISCPFVELFPPHGPLGDPGCAKSYWISNRIELSLCGLKGQCNLAYKQNKILIGTCGCLEGLILHETLHVILAQKFESFVVKLAKECYPCHLSFK